MKKKVKISEINEAIAKSINEEIDNIYNIQNDNEYNPEIMDIEELEDVDADKADEVLHYLFEAHSDLESLVYSLETEWEDPKNKEIYGKVLEIIKPMYEQIDDIKNNFFDFI